MTCINCGCMIGRQFVFQGVVVCGDCYKIANHYLHRTKAELQMLVQTYMEMLRVALIQGKLHPPRMPAGEVPRRQFTKAFQQLLEEITNADRTKKATDGDGTVQGMRSETEDTRRELRARHDAEAVLRGRELRPLPEVQADRDTDDHRDPTAAGADAANGVDQAPRR